MTFFPPNIFHRFHLPGVEEKGNCQWEQTLCLLSSDMLPCVSQVKSSVLGLYSSTTPVQPPVSTTKQTSHPPTGVSTTPGGEIAGSLLTGARRAISPKSVVLNPGSILLGE